MAAAFAPLAPHAERPMRVVVLDDDPVFRVVLSRMLKNIGLDVAATCADITSAQRRVSRGDIDAVTVDVVLRGESGLDFLKWCRATHPSTLNVLVTAGSERGARTGIDGVLLGAAALLTKPDAARLPGFENELKRVFSDGHGKKPARALVPPSGPALRRAHRRDLLAIGASTGGPPALLKLLKGLPTWFDAPVVITQHMPSEHLKHFAELLSSQTPRLVTLVSGTMTLERGKTYLAGAERHLQVLRQPNGALAGRPLDTPPEHHCRPAVDPMFASVAQACAGTALGVVLTGMGSDGAKGALQLRERGNPVLVQDEASSVVWGMPGSVMSAGAADAVIAIERMPTSILEWMEWTSRGNP